MKRAALLTVILLAPLVGCSTNDPAAEGEAYGATVEKSDPMVACISEAVHRYLNDDEASDAFREACLERASR